ncbi:dTDP-4-dehydrorhamnose 3,5-epimerase [Pleomorphomonas sp. PLEO]|uniref:dTDP-4-dehydrorhamnose 3,5-epimerase n=1 Tax=Pleomorphomonas sp. PLEO TaxID=3239306 RepID=UPI00351F6CD9
MQIASFPISGPTLIVHHRNVDSRGYFLETFRLDLFEQVVGQVVFVQDNQSMSAEVGTVRGLHFQLNPKAQGKLVRCLAGAVLDIAVDIRRGSPTYGQHVKVELSAENDHQLWIPSGFAHGFCTLEPNSVIAYKVTDYYSPQHDRGLRWNDPALDIDWPVTEDKAVLSAKDRVQPLLAELDSNFVFAG